MNYEHKTNLEKALLSQTWNKSLTGAVVDAIEEDLKKPKTKKAPSMLQLAIAKEKKKEFQSGPNISEGSEE